MRHQKRPIRNQNFYFDVPTTTDDKIQAISNSSRRLEEKENIEESSRREKQKKGMQQKSTSTEEDKLRIIYLVTMFHCVYMIGWSIASTFFHPLMAATESLPGNGYLPFRTFSKYEGHTLAYAAHIAPAIFWSFCIPLQFHPGVQKRYPRFHRYLGRAFVFTSCLMMFGAGYIVYKRMTWEHHVNRDDRDNEADPWVIRRLPGGIMQAYSCADLFLAVVGTVFLYTAWVAVGYARKKDYFNHKIWIIRHCGWGLWIVSQRLIITFVLVPVFIVLFGCDGEFSGRRRFHAFFWGGVAGIVASVSTAEYAIWIIKKERSEQRKNNTKQHPTGAPASEEPSGTDKK